MSNPFGDVEAAVWGNSHTGWIVVVVVVDYVRDSRGPICTLIDMV